ncbi:MAG: GntR family transcriptional regulator [Actinomycetota bacterium]
MIAPTAFAPPADLGEAVTAAVREMIITGEVSPGERLVETELSERFGTSRGPVRDALKALEDAGLVTSIPRRGSFVAELTDADIEEIYSLRSALESVAIERFSRSATPDDIVALEAVLVELAAAQAARNGRASAEADMRFHRLIVERAGHQRLRAAWERLAGQTLVLMSRLADLAPEVQAAAGDHRTIVEAITSGDGHAAQAVLRQHLADASRAMRAGEA